MHSSYSCHEDEPHGLDVSPDIPYGDLHDLMMSCYSANEVIEFTATKITIDTIGQGDDTRKRLWHEERRKHLIASSVGKNEQPLRWVFCAVDQEMSTQCGY